VPGDSRMRTTPLLVASFFGGGGRKFFFEKEVPGRLRDLNQTSNLV
jgi:hypothetical protein